MARQIKTVCRAFTKTNMYESEILNKPFDADLMCIYYGFELEQNEDFALITVSPDNSIMLYKELGIMSIDIDGSRYDLPKPLLIGDFIRDCIRLSIL
jgi:hypothetical protein